MWNFWTQTVAIPPVYEIPKRNQKPNSHEYFSMPNCPKILILHPNYLLLY